jgi:hypothetical protein
LVDVWLFKTGLGGGAASVRAFVVATHGDALPREELLHIITGAQVFVSREHYDQHL